MLPRRPLGRCSFLFLLAVSFDVLGLSLILVGVFAELELNGRSFGDFLIYGGGIVLFFSLLWWLAWYSLNLEVSVDELTREPPVSPVRRNLVQLALKVTESFSRRSRRKAEGAVPTTAAVLTRTTAILSPTTAALSPTTAILSPTTAILSPTTALELSAAPCSKVTESFSKRSLRKAEGTVPTTAAVLSPTRALELSAAPCREVVSLGALVVADRMV